MQIYISPAPGATCAICTAAADQIAVYGSIKRLDSCPDRFNQPSDAKDAHRSCKIVSKHMKADLGAYTRQGFGQEVVTSIEYLFERSEGMLHRQLANLYLSLIMLQSDLHRFDSRFMLPAL